MKTVKPLDCKAGSSGIERPLFSPGLLLEDEDLTAGVDYTRELSRLLFRSLFGCGVICGLEVKGELFCKRQQLRVTVGPGLALDGAGNPMQVTKSVPLATRPDCEPLPETVWVVDLLQGPQLPLARGRVLARCGQPEREDPGGRRAGRSSCMASRRRAPARAARSRREPSSRCRATAARS